MFQRTQCDKVTSRKRFYETLNYRNPDQIPYFEDGIRSETLREWRRKGLSKDFNPNTQFPTDKREEIKLDCEPHPYYKNWPSNIKELKNLQKRLNLSDSSRFPENWNIQRLYDHESVLMARVHEGFFQSMGVHDGRSFTRLMYQLVDQPDFVREFMHIQGKFAAELAERILKEVEFDAIIFSEPIGDNNGALISPAMYKDFVLPSYEPLLNLAQKYNVKTIIFRTYGNMKVLIPNLLKWGINCLWACEVEQKVMNYPTLRREFGKDLRLIGGIDLDALREGKDKIKQAIDDIAPLVGDGGFIPLADGRVRADVPFENYVYYRELLRQITQRN